MHSTITNHSKIMGNRNIDLARDLIVMNMALCNQQYKGYERPSTALPSPTPCQSNNTWKAFWREDSPAVSQLVLSILVPQYLAMKAYSINMTLCFKLHAIADLALLAFYYLL
jgi:hypothetical protein